MTTRHPSIRQAQGFSLTELLVAMVITLLLLGGLITLMVSSKRSYSQQDYSARLQENARFALQFLAYDIRMAGYYGCSNNIINDSSVAAITPTESGGGSTDSITISYGEPYDPGSEIELDPASYSPYSTPNTLVLNSPIPSEWKEGDTLIVGDCGGNSIGDIAASGLIPATNSVVLTLSNTSLGSLGRIYDPNSTVGGPITVRRLVTNVYTIANGQSGIPTLMRNNQELVEGVENLQLLYRGLSGGGFSTGASAPSDIAAVQLAALVRSVSNENLSNREYGSGADITEDKGQYTLLGTDVSSATPAIRGQRRVFNNTLMVRNHSL